MKTSLPFAMLADDVTGACDTGVQFAAVGLSTEVFLKSEGLPDTMPELTVLATETRNATATDSRAKITTSCERLKARGLHLVYKKIDSTLRGQIAAELEAAMRCFAFTHAVVTPAFPATGRILVDGWLRGCHGVDVEPVHLATLLRENGINDIRTLGLDSIRGNPEALSELFESGQGVVVVDAETESDLARITASCMAQSHKPLLVGSGGLAIPLARHFGATRSRSTTTKEHSRGRTDNRPVVLFIGSTNPVTVAQVQELIASQKVAEYRLGDSLAEVTEVLSDRQVILIRIPIHRVSDEQLQNDLSKLQALFLKRHVGGVVVSGGDTATAVSQSLKVSSIHLENEVLPGIPRGHFRGGIADGIAVATKAGGFGDVHALCEVVEHLCRAPITTSE